VVQFGGGPRTRSHLDSLAIRCSAVEVLTSSKTPGTSRNRCRHVRLPPARPV